MRNLILILAAVIALAACNSQANGKKSSVLNNAIPVKVIPVNGDTSVQAVHASGIVSTENEAKLSFKIGGIIEKIWVKEGDKVHKGQLLATLKSTEITAQVQQVQLSVEKAERDYDRALNLYKDSVATLEQLQNARTGVDIARQQMQQVSFNQQYSKIYAPADGFIVKKTGNAGELANPGSVVLLMNAFSSSSKWILKLGLSDREWAAVETGNKASITIDAYPGKTFSGVVSKKALAADPISGSFQVEIRVDFNTNQPAAGMFGKATIIPSHSAIGFSIPYEALLEANGKKGFVFVTNDKQTVKKATVTIAAISNNVAYISEGLEGYAYVVTSGSPYLSENASIIVHQ